MTTDIVYVYGFRTCHCVRALIPIVEKKLKKAGYIKKDLSGCITQGGYNNGAVPASAGTHDGGGVIDVIPSLVNTPAKRAIWRRSGFAMWYRRKWEGNWPEHGHGVVIGCPHASKGAKNQVVDYRNGLNGLANDNKDQGPRVDIRTVTEVVRQPTIYSTSVKRLIANAKSTAPRKRSADVIRLQRMLIRLGYMAELPKNELGMYGPKTLNAVKKVQEDIGANSKNITGYIDITSLKYLANKCKELGVYTYPTK